MTDRTPSPDITAPLFVESTRLVLQSPVSAETWLELLDDYREAISLFQSRSDVLLRHISNGRTPSIIDMAQEEAARSRLFGARRRLWTAWKLDGARALRSGSAFDSVDEAQ